MMTQITTKIWKKLDEKIDVLYYICDRWTLKKSEQAKFKRNESILTQRER